MAAAESGLSVSATASTPAGWPSMAASTGVLPCADSSTATGSSGVVSMSASASSRAVPTRTCRPATVARTPLPVTESNPVAASRDRPRSRVPATIAAARGCSLSASAAATSPRSSVSAKSPTGWMSVRAGLPAVMVPVLSSTTVSSLCAVSRASAERIRMPAWAPLPVPTMIDSGVARPSAQGQAMISTATAETRARVNAGGGPATNHTAKVAIATAMTTGTK